MTSSLFFCFKYKYLIIILGIDCVSHRLLPLHGGEGEQHGPREEYHRPREVEAGGVVANGVVQST